VALQGVNMSITMNDLKSELAKLIIDNERQIEKRLEVTLKQQETVIGNLQWRILDNLVQSPKGLSMKELSKLTHTNDSTLTKIVDRMVSESLVYRRPAPKDRRKIMIVNSNKGRVLHQNLQSNVTNCYDDAFSSLSENQLVSLQGILSTLHQARLN
jgi:DNA-binding MarR family transcriptional regulator